MINAIFDELDETKIIGSEFEGTVTLFLPVPEGDSFDDLLLDSCRAILYNPRLRQSVNGWRRLSSDLFKSEGVPSELLLETVARWIQSGNLRDVSQVNEALANYLAWATRMTELGIFSRGLNGSPEWQFDRLALHQLGWFFGIAGSRPLPTKSEYLAEQAAAKQRWEEQERENAKKSREMRKLVDEYELERAKEARITNLIQKIAARVFPFPAEIDFNADEMLPEHRQLYDEVRKNRREFRAINYKSVSRKVDEGLTDEDVEKYFRD